VRQLTTQAGEASFPAFSPDGDWIAYYRILDGRRDIMTLSLSGGETHQFTDDPSDDVHPMWSPDGANLGFVSSRSGTWQIWIAAIQDGRRTGEPWQLSDLESTATFPSWSPDGKLVAFLAHQGNQSAVYVIEPRAGSTPRQITHNSRAAAVAWDPATGNLLVAAPWEETKVSLRRFSTDGSDLGPTRFPVEFGEKLNYTRFAVSVDGRLIVYVRQQLTGDVSLLESEEKPY
jgi:Tol biopolymer transport system component